jgi:hypothetical protein
MSGQSAFYIREDTITKKIYLYNSFLGDLLQYNFALQVGDTFPNNNVNDYILTSIDTVPIASGSRRRFIFNNSSTIPIIWIEGIGNMADPFNPPRRYDSTFANILCVHENLNLVYEYPFMFPVTCGLYNSDTAITNSKSIADIFPNPVHDLLNVVFYSNSIFQNKILVFDVTGRELVNFNCKDRFIKLNFENQPNGIYLIKIIESDHVFSKLIIKN